MQRNTALDRHVAICRVLLYLEGNEIKPGYYGDPVRVSMRDMAMWLGLAPSSYLMRRLRECVQLGYLSEQKSIYRSNIVASKFSLLIKGRSLARWYEENKK